MVRSILVAVALQVLGVFISIPSASAEDIYHAIPWRTASSVACIRAPSTLTRAQLDEALAATGRGENRGTALELIATCAVPRREVAQSFNRGGLVHHRASRFADSARFFFQALQADPSFLPARFNLACAHARQGHSAAAIGEIGQIVRAGSDGRRWLSRVRTDPDFASILGDEHLEGLLAGRWRPADPIHPPLTDVGFGPPSPTGPVWEPIAHTNWADFRALLIASGLFGQRRNFRPAERWTPSHAELTGLVPFTEPSWWRPEPGLVYLVVPFTIAGPNQRVGMLAYWWTGSDYVAACHEYCNRLSSPGAREVRYQTSNSREVRILRCRRGSTTCSIRSIFADGPTLRHRPASHLVRGVVP